MKFKRLRELAVEQKSKGVSDVKPFPLQEGSALVHMPPGLSEEEQKVYVEMYHSLRDQPLTDEKRNIPLVKKVVDIIVDRVIMVP